MMRPAYQLASCHHHGHISHNYHICALPASTVPVSLSIPAIAALPVTGLLPASSHIVFPEFDRIIDPAFRICPCPKTKSMRQSGIGMKLCRNAHLRHSIKPGFHRMPVCNTITCSNSAVCRWLISPFK